MFRSFTLYGDGGRGMLYVTECSKSTAKVERKKRSVWYFMMGVISEAGFIIASDARM